MIGASDDSQFGDNHFEEESSIPLIPSSVNEDVEDEDEQSWLDKHSTKEKKPRLQGKHKGMPVIHFKCNYCPKVYVGPSPTTFKGHLIEKHSKMCPELMNSVKPYKPPMNFFAPTKKREKFESQVLISKVLKLVITADLPFSLVDNECFQDVLQYLKQDLNLESRRNYMRKLEELYQFKFAQLKDKLNSFEWKYSITCDVWTSKNQLSFFGFTIHYIDKDWKLQEGLLAFKFLEGEHDGKSLSNAFISVLEELGIAERLLGVTADNASNNSKMMSYLEQYYDTKYPAAGFSVAWNQIECLAHVVNLAAQEILNNFKQPIESDAYVVEDDASDAIVSAVSRLAFLVRKIRLSPKLRRLMQIVCEEKKVKYLVPIIDVPTRWNSTYDMLCRALVYKDCIAETIYRHRVDRLISLVLKDDENKNDWQCVQNLIDVLKPFKGTLLLYLTY